MSIEEGEGAVEIQCGKLKYTVYNMCEMDTLDRENAQVDGDRSVRFVKKLISIFSPDMGHMLISLRAHVNGMRLIWTKYWHHVNGMRLVCTKCYSVLAAASLQAGSLKPSILTAFLYLGKFLFF